MSISAWGGRRAQQARAVMARRLPCPCHLCGETVTAEEPWVIEHVKSRLAHPELTWDVANWAISHRRCSDASANEAVAEKALRDAGFSPPEDSRDSPARPSHTHGGQSAPVQIREELTWAHFVQVAPAWFSDVLEIPEDASPPLAITPPHPEATCTYGPEAVAWMEENLLERGRPLRLRWWQKLAVYVQLQHREDGSLCFRTVVESTPRQVGKSARVRSVSLWRLAIGPSLFEPEQLIVHTGRTLSIVREVVKAAWAWAGAAAQTEAGWSIRKGMTDPEVAYLEVNRWIPRSKDDGTGYSPSYVPIDEAWDVRAETVDDDLEPSTVARLSPQVHLISTAHRRATSLMRGRISSALADDDEETLLLWWGTPPGADITDRSVWRSASPYWDAARAKLMEAAYLRAEAGEADPEADDMTPMDAFRCQWLNQWPLKEKRVAPGKPLVSAEAWRALTETVPSTVSSPPAAVAVESWPGAGVSVVAAWVLEDGRTLVSASAHPDVVDAAAAAKAWGSRSPLLAGKSLAEDPAFKGMRVKPQTMAVVSAVAALSRLLDEGVLVHDGGEHLAAQVLAMRTKATPSGLRVTSAGPADAVKAMVWAVTAARARRSRSGGRIILPSAISA